MFENIFYYLSLLFKTKYKIKPPKSSEVLIYDHGAEQLNFLNFDKCSIFYNRGEELNLFILFKSIFLNGFSNITHNYRITYIKYINPKFIITYRCDNKNFYELKKFIKNTKNILIQWGKTIEGHFKYFQSLNNDYDVDEMYLQGEETAKVYSKYIKGKCFAIGSLSNNRIVFDDNNSIKKNSLVFISQHKPKRPFPEIERIIIKFLKRYCLKKNLTLSISTRVLASDKKNKKHYEAILGQSDWNYFPREDLGALGDTAHYRKVLSSEYIVSIDSTLGYEALSRKKKVVFFPLGSYSKEWCKKNYVTNLKTKTYWIPEKFGYPLNLNQEGEFWTSEHDEKKMEEKLNYLISIDENSWDKLLKDIGLEKIIKFNPYNEVLIKNLKKIGVPLKKDY
ncbi:MAG: hypothetical protein ISQ92_00495 [Pelagibacteraceae bacterium]|jgi:surface carbohydrate biosynthesis protein|nr:hypothetical protein [Pelagibacteraceae bacterium]